MGLSLAITVSVMVLVNRDSISLLGSYSYPSVFFFSMVMNSTILFPFPMGWVYFVLGSMFHPVPLALAGGAGAAIGEFTGYIAGRSGRSLLSSTVKYPKWNIYNRVEGWLNKWGVIVIFGLNLQPFIPFDVAGLAAGAAKFPVWKFYLASMAGRSLAYGIIAYLGYRGYIPSIPFFEITAQ